MDELAPLRASVRILQQLAGAQRRGDITKDILEGPLRNFLSIGAPPGLMSGRGYRALSPDEPLQDLDILFDGETADWHSGVRLGVEATDVLVHVELAFRSTWNSTKFREDLCRVQATIDAARTRSRKTWGALVFLGDASVSVEKIGAELHRWYHQTPLAQWSCPPLGMVWPFVDVVAAPTFLCKKYHLFVDQTDEARTVPGVMHVPTFDAASDSLHALVPLRRALHRFLAKLNGHVDVSSPLWSAGEQSELLGGTISADAADRVLSVPAFFALDGSTADVIWDRYADRTVRYCKELSRRCSAGHGFAYFVAGAGESGG